MISVMVFLQLDTTKECIIQHLILRNARVYSKFQVNNVLILKDTQSRIICVLKLIHFTIIMITQSPINI